MKRTARMALVFALALGSLAFSACATNDSGQDVLLCVKLAGVNVQTVEVEDHGPVGSFDEALRPQMDGDIGVIWTDSTGETLDEGWVARSTDDSGEVYLLLPAPTTDTGLLTISVKTDSGTSIISKQIQM